MHQRDRVPRMDSLRVGLYAPPMQPPPYVSSAATRRVFRGVRRLGASLLAASLLATPACTGLEPAAIGAAVSGAQSGVTLLSDTQVWSYELATFGDVVDVTHIAADTLSLRKLNERDDQADRYWVYYRYGVWRKVVVEIIRETPTVTSIRVSVKSRNERGMATMFLRQVFQELKERGAYLDDIDASRAGSGDGQF
jgi:hypothetical protein